MKGRLILTAALAFLLVPTGWASAKPASAKQRRAFVCNYQAAERGYEGPAMAAYVRRCLKRHRPAP
jgi:hypothetical protein